jgi:Na+-driven multidrug efflux pump
MLSKNLRELGVPYLRILLPSIPISLAAFGAFSAFFSGRGKTKFISLVAVVCNALNIFLDVLLVFGIGPFPEMGIRGSAWGTVLSQCAALFLFAAFFLSKKNWKKFGVSRMGLNGEIFMKCLRIGLPSAISALVNFTLWSWIFQVIASCVSGENFTAFGTCQSAVFSLIFISEGISMGVATIVSNAYGGQNWKMIGDNRRSWIHICLLFIACSFLILIVWPEPLLRLLVHGTVSENFLHTLRFMFFCGWFSTAGESFCFTLRQTLTAFGDTYYTMVVGLICYGLVVIVPSYFLVHATRHAASFLIIEGASQILVAFLYNRRYRVKWAMGQFRPISHRPSGSGA